MKIFFIPSDSSISCTVKLEQMNEQDSYWLLCIDPVISNNLRSGYKGRGSHVWNAQRACHLPPLFPNVEVVR